LPLGDLGTDIKISWLAAAAVIVIWFGVVSLLLGRIYRIFSIKG
jgi:hypothetical protein